MRKEIDPEVLRRLESLRAPFKARLREIVVQLASEPGNMSLLLEADFIRRKFLEIQCNLEGGAI